MDGTRSLPRRSVLLAALACVGLAATVPGTASAAPSSKKAIWGPVERDGRSQFPIYHKLGAGTFQMSISWRAIARQRPAHPRDPSDPAYVWPTEVDRAVAQGHRYKIRVMVAVAGSPRWANGGRGRAWAPKHPSDYGHFMAAAAKRYPDVHLWMAWGEPTKSSNFKPLADAPSGRRHYTRKQKAGPRRYARMLDSAYGEVKRVSRRNKVIGGNSFTTGTVPPLVFLKLLRLPNGKPPRMDLYGHNPFTARKPRLSKGPLGYGYADFSDLDTLSHAIDRNLARRGQRHLRLFLSEFTLPTDHENYAYNFWVSRKVQASWLKAALRIAHHYHRIYTLGWIGLYDDPPRSDHLQVNGGLMTWHGKRKPAFKVFARG
jgi:hypothetical protein